MLPNGECFAPKFANDCSRQGVIFLMLCHCQAFDVGKTMQQFRQRINVHVYYSSNGKMLIPVSHHLDLCRRFDTSVINLIVLEVVKRDPRGGKWDQRILQKQTFWTERLSALSTPGLNEICSSKPFLG